MISFQLEGGLLYIPISVQHYTQNISLNAIIDTGSAGTAVDINNIRPDFSRDARLAEIVGVGGQQPAVIQNVDQVALGNITFKDFPIEFADLENTFGIEAIVGNDLLKLSNVNIDFPTHSLSLKKET